MELIKDPTILNDVFSETDFLYLKDFLFNHDKPKDHFDKGFGRYHISNQLINSYAEKLIPKARDVFNSSALLPSYSLFSHYEGENAKLWKHKDDNACTYTIDLCVYQSEPWDLWVDEKAYTLYPNQALAYYGNDQTHWREEFPNKESGNVAMIFFHFVEPDHWWFTKGPKYIDVLRGIIKEDEYVR